MNSPKRLSVVAVFACAVVLVVGLSAGVAAAKKKKKNSAAVVTKTLNTPIPDRAAGTPTTNPPYGKVAVPLEIGKKFKGKTVGAVQLTYQTTGVTPDAAFDLMFRLTAPSGLTLEIQGNGFSGQSVGPVTFISDTPVQTCWTFPGDPVVVPPCSDPDQTLAPPYQGVARDFDLPLFEGLKMRGTWTLTAFDTFNSETSVLNMVSLKVIPQKAAK
jgi:hypothetical protein